MSYVDSETWSLRNGYSTIQRVVQPELVISRLEGLMYRHSNSLLSTIKAYPKYGFSHIP